MSCPIVEILSGLETKVFSLFRASQVPYNAKILFVLRFIFIFIYSYYPYISPIGVGGMGASSINTPPPSSGGVLGVV